MPRRQVTLEELKAHKGGALAGMALFTTARLSVQPVTRAEWDFVLGLAAQPAPGAAEAGGGGAGAGKVAAARGGGKAPAGRGGKKK